MKKRFLYIIYFCIAAVLFFELSACESFRMTSAGDNIVVSGVFVSSANGKKIVEEINKKYPNIYYKASEFSYNANNALPTAVVGQLPTMYEVPYTEPQRIINAGYAGKVTEEFKKYGYDKIINKKYLDMVYKDGEYYGIPTFVYNMGLMCNIKLFEEAGLVDEDGYPVYPSTYEELAKTASIIKQKTGKPGFYLATTQNHGGWQFMNIAWSYGVDFVKEENGRLTAAFNTPECAAALQYVKDLKWKYNVLPDEVYGDSGDLITRHKDDGVGMNFMVSSELDRYIYNGWDKDNIAVCRLPAGPVGRYSLQGGVVYMFNKDITPEQAEACFLWISRIYSADTDAETEENLKEEYKIRQDGEYIVGCPGTNVWNSAEYDAMVERLQREFANVDLKYFEDFQNGEGVTYRMEERVNTQELYHLLDIAIQTVLLDENADPAKLIAEAADKYQKNYLDKVSG